ncbi:hypothetical protein PHYC_01123 [Phycisphaerales bacterium]|nr:hypothetical protein PHYC_01123 [Phycisphaerales bacterium]
MNRKQEREAALRALRASPSDEDGLNPKFDHPSDSRPPARKDLQLCKQAFLAISGELATLRSIAALGLDVLCVEPEDGARRLRVIVLYDRRRCVEAGALEALSSIRGRLRTAIASAITRKRTPALSFVLIPREAVQDV